jgi:hypothetical protein
VATERQPEVKQPVSAPAQGAEIQEHVERMLASPGFRIPARRARLLRYLAERAVAGRCEQINEYSIGVDVFERPESFDPKTDAVVRADVSRLRQNLKEYYSGQGRADSMVLELPARSYILVLRAQQKTANADRPSRPTVARRRWIWFAAATGLALAAVLAVVFVLRWLTPRTPEPPPFSLAVLPATVTPAAADFADSADAFSQEVGSALRSTRGLSMLGWMNVTGLRGVNALEEARIRLPVALILETEIDRREGTLQARFRLYGRNGEHPVWSATAPLGDAARLGSSVGALVSLYLSPILERDFNIVSYRRATGAARIQPVFSGLPIGENPCAAKQPFFQGLGRPAAQVSIGAQALGARSPDTRIEMFANGQRAYPLYTVHTQAGISISLRAPALVQLAADTCVLAAASGDAPVYDDNCIVPPPGSSDVRLMYACAPKAAPIDIAGLTNDATAWNEETFPAGPRILAGVPFLIPQGVKRFWDAGTPMRGARPATLTIPVKQPAVSKVFFLMNTLWGQPGPASYLSVAFAGDHGAYFEKKLIGGVDIRDYNRGVYTNTINGVTSRPAFENGRGQRMDLVEVKLPSDFQRQSLQTITLTDTGRYSFQRAILWAVTVQ